MIALYSLFLALALPFARVAAMFNPKLRRGLDGRKELIETCEKHYGNTTISGPRILIHVASFGELEQAKPIITALRSQYRSAHIHLTFFSPSGYENTIGKYSDANLITYSPIDLPKAVSQFLEIVKPDIVLFVKYDVWPNIARELSKRKIPSILFAAAASDQSGRMLPIVRSLNTQVFQRMTKIVTISEDDIERFTKLGVDHNKLVIGGDTRFDQVLARKDSVEEFGDKLLPEIILKSIGEKNTLVFVAGSSWESDEQIYLETLKNAVERGDNILSIIVPHEPSEEHVRKLLAEFPGKSIRLSQISEWNSERIIVVDSIGKLFGLYQYADIAMIGGGFGTGLHNILEAAVWNVPAIVGPNHTKAREVAQLIDRLAAFEVKIKKEFEFVFWRLAESDDLRRTAGEQALEFVKQNAGATGKIMREINPNLMIAPLTTAHK